MPLSPFKMLMDLLLPRLSLSIDKTSCRWQSSAWHCSQAPLLPGSIALRAFIASKSGLLMRTPLKEICSRDSAHRGLSKAPGPCAKSCTSPPQH